MFKHAIDKMRSQLLAHLQEREEQAAFLANASSLLIRTSQLVAARLDTETTLADVSRLTLPYAGAWSILDVRDGDTVRRIPVSHPTPRQEEFARDLLDGWPPARDAVDGGIRVLRTGASETVCNVTDAMLCDSAGSPDQLRLLRELRIGSMLTVALTAGGEVIGSLTFIAPRWGHAFDDRDRRLAEQVAAGAALAIINSRNAVTDPGSGATARVTRAQRLEFMSSLSHTFRTPLHNIYGYAQLLDSGVRGVLTGDQRHDVQRIQANERHLLQLVDAVISYARWDDAAEMVLEDVSVRDAVRRADAVVTCAAAKKGVYYDPGQGAIARDLMVRADPARLHHVLVHLMLNAVKFSRPGDSIVVRAVAVGTQSWIRVTDTGIGIARSELALIFQPFGRARDQYALDQDGVGLGLTLTQTLARAMGGDLSVVSEAGSGSTFTLALPSGRASRPEAALAAPSGALTVATPSPAFSQTGISREATSA